MSLIPGTVYLVIVFESPPKNYRTHTFPQLTDNGWLIVLDDGSSFFTDANIITETVPDL